MRRIGLTLALSLGLGALALWLVIPSSFSRETFSTFLTLTLPDFALLGAVWAFWAFTGGVRSCWFVACTGQVLPLWRGVQVHFMGTVAASVSPTAGGNAIGIVWLLHRFGIPFRRGVAVSVLTLIFDMTFFAWSVPCSFLYLMSQGVALPFRSATTLVTAFSLALIALCYLLIFRLPLLIEGLKALGRLRWLERFQERLGRVISELELTHQNLRAAPWWVSARLHGASALLWLSRFGILAATFYVFTTDVGLLEIISFNTLCHALAFAIPTPGASGYYELIVAWLFKGSAADALLSAIVVVWRFLTYYIYLLIGPLIGGATLLGDQTATPD